MPRNARPDAEGYYYFAKMPSGYLYGPYSNRGTAAGVATQMGHYNKNTKFIWDYRTSQRIPNPRHNPNWAEYPTVVRAKLSVFEDAPRLTQRERLNSALTRLADIEQKLAARGITLD